MTVGDYEKVVESYVMNEEWLKAIDVLNRQVGLSANDPFTFAHLLAFVV